MKKVLAIILSVLMVGFVFVACSAESDDKSEPATVAEDTYVSTTETIETEQAVVKESDAIHFIQDSYTAEELGLDKVEDDYTFMVGGSGVEIDGKKYVKVAANVMSQSDVTTEEGSATYKLTPVGEYYISYDGKTVLMKNMETGEYSELQNRYDDYKEKGETVQTEAEKDATEKE
ncbi:MAG: hypothetical protein ACI4V4_07250 [Eubacterium sp.]